MLWNFWSNEFNEIHREFKKVVLEEKELKKL